MTQTQQELERLRTLQESFHDLDDKINVVLPALADKIDNIQLPEIDTTELAKQGEDPEATNTAIYNAVQSKLTPLEAVLTELNNGKQEMVDALATKNVQSSTNKTLSAIADDVRSIAQSPINIVGEEMYENQLFGAPTDMEMAYYQPNSPRWNLYKVMIDLLNDGRFMNYGGIVLVEFPIESDTILLSGVGASGAYLTSDGFLYEIDTTHTWSDIANIKANRWVAYLYASADASYTILNESLCPTSIYVGRSIRKIECTLNGRITEIVVIEGGSIGTINITGTQKWLPSSIIKSNFVIPNKGSIGLFNLTSNDNVNYIEVGVEGEFKSGDVVVGKKVRDAVSLSTINLPDVEKMSGGRFICTSPTECYFTKLTTLKAEKLKEITQPIIAFYDQNNAPNLKYYIFPELKKISLGTSSLIAVGKADVKLVVVGAMETDLNLSLWGRYDGYITDYALVNHNIRTYIADRIADGGCTLTVTFGQYLYNNLEQATLDAFTAKNWRVANGG